MPRRRVRRRRKRSQSDVFISVVEALRSRSGKGLSIRKVAKKSGTTWRTAKVHVSTLRKAGLVETVKRKGMKRKKYKLKHVR